MASKAKLTTRQATSTSVTSDNLNKGSELTFAEMDSNLINLRDQTIGIVADDSATINIAAGDNLYIQGGTNVTTSTNSDGSVTINATTDTTNFGDLTATGSTITAPSNADLTLTTSGTGDVVVTPDSFLVKLGGSDSMSVAQASGTGQAVLQLEATAATAALKMYQTQGTVGSPATTSTGAALTEIISHAYHGGNIEVAKILTTNVSSNARDAKMEFQTRNKDTTNLTTALLIDETQNVTVKGAIKISDDGIETIRSNEDLVLETAGTGSVAIDKVAITGGTITGITDLAVADGGTGASSLTDNAVLTGTGTSAITAEGNLSFNGSTLAVTGAATVSTTLGVTGASTLDGVLILDNHISSAASNADLHIDTSGTGQIKTSAALIGVGDQTGGNIILTDQADGSFQTAQYANPGMLNPSGLQVDSAGSFHYSQLVLNNFSEDAYNSLWATRSRTNTHGANEYLQSGNTIFNFFAAGWNGDTDGSGYFSANAQFDMFASENHDASNRGGGVNIRTINTGASSGATIKFEMTDNVVIKNPKAATTAALAVEGSIRLKNTSNPSNVTDSAHIFAKDDGSTSEVYVRDEAGNETKISPHNQSGQWEYYSRNVNTGKVFRVNMEKMIKKLEDITGESFIEQE